MRDRPAQGRHFCGFQIPLFAPVLARVLLRKNSVGVDFFPNRFGSPSTSIIIVRQISAVIVGFQPLVEVNLIKVGTHEFFPQCVCLAANERYLQTREGRN